MKKTVFTLIFVISLLTLGNTAKGEISDIKNHWAETDINYLIEMEVVDGFPDGSFRPEDELQIDHLIKMIVTGLGFTDIENGKNYWADSYIEKAVEIGIIDENEFQDYTEFITRKQIAKMTDNALEYKKGHMGSCSCSDDIDLYRSVFKDYLILDEKYLDHISKAYKEGLTGGYPDGTFRQDRTATRAESCTMLCRLLNEERRLSPDTPMLTDFMQQYNTQEGFDEFIDESGIYLYTNADKYRLDGGRYIVEKDTYSSVEYAEGYIPDGSYIEDLSEKIYDMARVLYGDGFYVGIDYFNHDDDEELNSVITLKFTESRIKYMVDNFDFRYKFYEAEPVNYGFDDNTFLLLNIRKLNPTFIDNEKTTYYNLFDHGFTSDEHSYRIKASLIKIFGYMNGLEIGDYVIGEYIKKLTDNKITYGYEDIKIFGDIKVRSYIPDWTYDTIIEFSYAGER